MKVTYPNNIEVLLPDSNYNYTPFEYIDKLKAGEYSENIFYFFEENIKDFNDSLKAKKILKDAPKYRKILNR